jgi:hypothetical protein
MIPKSSTSKIGIGPTSELSLRVSVGALVRVLFENPSDGQLMLALERKATLLKEKGDSSVKVKAQPFGGALRILDPITLQENIGEFRFDSEESGSEQDFRILIRPSAWKTVRELCLKHFRGLNHPILESDPARELTEEFAGAFGIDLLPAQYSLKSIGVIVEDTPSPTENFYARGNPTVRIYHTFEARILDSALASAIQMNSESYTDQDLLRLALEDSTQGGRGWYNAALTLPLSDLRSAYLSTALEARNNPIFFRNHRLDETVAAILDGVTVPKYRSF